MTSLRNGLQNIAERLLDSPKTTTAISTYSTVAGVASMQQWITGIGSTLAVFAGLIGVLVMARLNLIRSENEKIRGKILREKAIDLGVELDEE